MDRYISGEPYEDCLVSRQRDYLRNVKLGCYGLEEARSLMNEAITYMQSRKDHYMQTVPVLVDRGADEVLRTATVEILRKCFIDELVK